VDRQGLALAARRSVVTWRQSTDELVEEYEMARSQVRARAA
jgi:hypothetical protein